MTAQELELMISCIGRENVLDADVYIERWTSGTLLPHQTCITLDDGLQCQYHIALPVLQRHNIRAAWHIFTCVHQERTLEQLEVYKYFQAQCYPSVDEFYTDFFAAAERNYGPRVKTALESAEAATHASHAPFYTLSDRKFRYIRDIVLTSDEFFSVILHMMAVCDFGTAELLDKLWMNAEQIRELVRLGHLVGLHSHTHNRNMDEADLKTQQHEYGLNHQQLCDLVHVDQSLSTYLPRCMAHPLGKWNVDATSSALDDLAIEIGSRA